MSVSKTIDPERELLNGRHAERPLERVSPRARSTMWSTLHRFCMVGASGVGVNLGVLYVAQSLGFLASISSAIAIQLSICSNFILNEFWTFQPQESERDLKQIGHRAIRFQLVSLVGAVVQWAVFLVANLGWLYFELAEGSWDLYYQRHLSQGAWHSLILSPPEVGGWVYLSQVVGIGASTAWNFLLNYHWTWASQEQR